MWPSLLPLAKTPVPGWSWNFPSYTGKKSPLKITGGVLLMFLSALSHRGEASLLKYNFKVMIIGMTLDGHLVKVTSPPKGVGLFKLLLQMPFISFGVRSWSSLGRSCLPLCCLSGENDDNPDDTSSQSPASV